MEAVRRSPFQALQRDLQTVGVDLSQQKCPGGQLQTDLTEKRDALNTRVRALDGVQCVLGSPGAGSLELQLLVVSQSQRTDSGISEGPASQMKWKTSACPEGTWSIKSKNPEVAKVSPPPANELLCSVTVRRSFECEGQTWHRRSSPSTCSRWTSGNECRRRRLAKELSQKKLCPPHL